MTTFLLIGVLGSLFALNLLFTAGMLRLVGPRLSATASTSFRWYFRLTGALTLLNLLVGIPLSLTKDTPLEWVVILIGIVVAIWLIARLLQISFGKAILPWLVCVLGAVPSLAILILVVQPFLLELFAKPTNSMAPTILGAHWTGTCPQCGSPAYCSSRQGDPEEEDVLMICSQELRAYEVHKPPKKAWPGDQFAVNKMVKPARWDIIVYRFPQDPSQLYTSRLVGLPGEKLVIEDGRVWINGEKLTPPEPNSGLYYENKMDPPLMSESLWGAPDNPVELGPDEYFVLGDFSAHSRDSRLWSEEVDGHPPYALPAENIVGVVTHIYWPPSRWRIFR